jgi:hypothetical protein
VKYPQGHGLDLRPYLESDNYSNTWACDEHDDAKGCKRGLSDFGLHTGVPQFWCDAKAKCDYILCDACYKQRKAVSDVALLVLLVLPAPSPIEAPSPTVSPKPVQPKVSFPTPPEPLADVAPLLFPVLPAPSWLEAPTPATMPTPIQPKVIYKIYVTDTLIGFA